MGKKKSKKEKVIIDVGKEHKGRITGRTFTAIDATTGRTLSEVSVSHVKESKQTGGSDVYLTKTPGKPLKIHKTRQDVASSFPRISPKLPKLR